MKERPILFSGAMVRAILEGRKTQTRRIVKPSLLGRADGLMMEGEEGEWCPYGKPGDLLWVREGHTFGDCSFGESPWVEVGYRADGDDGPLHKCHCTEEQVEEAWDWVEDKEACGDGGMNWRSPLHMPRWAARIVRPITEIRIERVQEISEEDAEAEGVYHDYNLGELARYRIRWPHLSTGQCLYRALWNEINAKPKPRYGREGDKKIITHYEAFPWSLEDFDGLYPGAWSRGGTGTWKGKPLTVYPNPWVWCISFERVKEADHA